MFSRDSTRLTESVDLIGKGFLLIFRSFRCVFPHEQQQVSLGSYPDTDAIEAIYSLLQAPSIVSSSM